MALKMCKAGSSCPLARLGVPVLPVLLTIGICITTGLWCAGLPGLRGSGGR